MLLSSKPRYEVLDGLRGVAAIMVVLFHLGETYGASPSEQMINHGYLAVDFFFLLSGFVIGYAYDDRWQKMSLTEFFKRRLIRLHPMVIMGTLIGAALYGFGTCDTFHLIGTVEWWKVALCFVMGCLMIPCSTGLDIRGWGETNSFNGPNWTLTWEYAANILYAVVLRFLPKWILALLVCLAAVCTLDLALNWNIFGLLTAERAAQMYTVIGGWSLTPEQLYIGATRLSFPFLCGLLLSRIGRFITLRNGFFICSAAIIATLSVPHIGSEPNVANGAYNALVILIFFPIILLMGAGSSIKSSRGKALCNFLGEISYPLYITHYPILYLQMSWAWNNPDAPTFLHIMTAVGSVLLALGIAYGCMKLYDLPLRKLLSDKMLNRRH